MAASNLFRAEDIAPVHDNPRRSDIVYSALREAVLAGRVPEDRWLREGPIANELGVSRVTVKAALARLVADGLGVQEPYRGVHAIRVSLGDIDELFRLRSMLEGYALERAAARITEDDLERMRQLLPLTSALNDEHAQEALAANQDFHWIPILASDASWLIQFLGVVWNVIRVYLTAVRLSTRRVQSDVALDLGSHRDLVGALERRDGDSAREVIVAHIQRTVDDARAAVWGRGDSRGE